MVLIISENQDQSTNQVIDWISTFKKAFIRINPEDKITQVDIQNGEVISFSTKTENIHLDNISSVWYRRGYFNFEKIGFQSSEFPFNTAIKKYETKERIVLNDYLFQRLMSKKSLGNFHNTDVNKLEQLSIAREVGLKIPDTLITTQKKELEKFLTKHPKIITKSIGEVIYSIEAENRLTTYTTRLEDTHGFDESFFPSLFQEEIPKRYELRVFYLDGSTFTMAIFSQADKQTAIDFRIYNNDHPNRMTPFELPKEIDLKIQNFMKKAGHDTGSIDLIVSPEKEYYFLEVNPVGQFGMVSYPCNFGLEKKIAEYLCNIN